MIRFLSSLFIILFCNEISLANTYYPVPAKHAMVVTEQKLATEVGMNILQQGGNAFDAAVAVGYALSVVFPCCGNIGGGGFATLHLANGKNIFLNFREKAPLAATSNMFLDADQKLIPELSTKGYLAVGVPGTVMGLESLLKKYGTMTRKQVMAPAISLAEKGYDLTAYDLKLFTQLKNTHQKNIAQIFLDQNGNLYPVGHKLIQKELANTLKLIAAHGPKVFYRGKIAEEIVKASEKNGGKLSLKDFASYYVEELTPLTCQYHQYQIISSPPPSSGGTTLCEMLNVLELYPLKKYGFHTKQSTQVMVEAMRYAFYDRNMKLGDPDFVKNPIKKLISKKYAQHIKNKIDQHILPNEVIPNKETLHTTHYSIIDDQGNAIAVTYTLNAFFGAKVIAGHTGFFLNDEMDDFAAKPNSKNKFGLYQGNNNKVEPQKRPLSSMTPTFVMKDKKIIMILGSPGGPRIITSVLETFINQIVFGMNLQQAVNAPRFHYQWIPNTVYIEANTFPHQTMSALRSLGYHFTPSKPWGAVESIYIDPKTKIIYGANDRRRPDGAAMGY